MLGPQLRSRLISLQLQPHSALLLPSCSVLLRSVTRALRRRLLHPWLQDRWRPRLRGSHGVICITLHSRAPARIWHLCLPLSGCSKSDLTAIALTVPSVVLYIQQITQIKSHYVELIIKCNSEWKWLARSRRCCCVSERTSRGLAKIETQSSATS